MRTLYMTSSKEKFKYSRKSIALIRSMNALNTLSCFYIVIKNPTIYVAYMPHSVVCLSSVCYWSNPKNEVVKVIDYSCVLVSLLNTWCWSFQKNREMMVTSAIIIVMFLYSMSMHYKRVNKERECVLYHCYTYLVANIGIVIAFS